ncbi:DUF2628 domain-containing protein [Affinibrenneria salicis]|uniref:DUF2628 domain-containing protein n=1 Tax=Affinibrenneria salicis TaxID=2590031 RepID=A0A5J5FX09_9GAMM|nr:DUF2628 domain-containing protein [Affinibrenneria salicis]KAA8998462.1 DUF2628 domain-containing protein [Affinibrenneria salicis]
MKTFDIYRHPVLGYQIVKRGFCWPAFFFGIIWLLVKRLWLAAGLIVGFLILVGIGSELIGLDDNAIDHLFNLLGLGVAVTLGSQGNSLRSKNLQSKSYTLVRSVQAQNPSAALAKVDDKNDTLSV